MAYPKPQTLPRLAYSINEACEVLSIGKTKFYEEIAAGRIKPLKAGMVVELAAKKRAQQ